MNHYNSVEGTLKAFKLPNKILTGMNVLVKNLFYDESSIKWYYAEPPRVQSVKSGISTVFVRLSGDLEVS